VFEQNDKQRLLGVIALSLTVFAAGEVRAQATRTWVSGVGDDANPCSRTAPCKTFAGAISKTATGGEINAIDPGGYGPVTITKSITIDGTGTQASILASGTNGIVVSAPGAAVVIRNVSINGTGTGFNGVRFLDGRRLTLEKVIIQNFTQEAVRFAPAATADLVIRDSMLRGSQFGVRLQPGASGFANALIADTLIEGNQGGGVRADDGTSVTIRNAVLHGNATVGFNAVSSAGGAVDAAIVNTVASNNGANGFVAQVPSGAGYVSMAITDSSSLQNGGDGVLALGAATIRLAGSRVWGNGGTGINPTTGSILSMGNNVNQANVAPGAPNGAFGTQ
jgi:hypothetical protein